MLSQRLSGQKVVVSTRKLNVTMKIKQHQ